MRLVTNANRAWRWFSVQAMTAAIALQAGWQAMPPDLAERIPAEWVTGLSIAVLVLGIVGRLVDQGGSDA
jgi:hypothetical protein